MTDRSFLNLSLGYENVMKFIINIFKAAHFSLFAFDVRDNRQKCTQKFSEKLFRAKEIFVKKIFNGQWAWESVHFISSNDFSCICHVFLLYWSDRVEFDFVYLCCVCKVERFSHIVIVVWCLVWLVGNLWCLKWLSVNLLSSLERMIVARYIGHDGTFVRLWCVDQIYWLYHITPMFIVYITILKVSTKTKCNCSFCWCCSKCFFK